MSGIGGIMADSAQAIEIVNLHKKFGPLEVLKGVSLSAKPGDVIAIIGGSGSGKSTFLRCINLLEQPSAGTITYPSLTRDRTGWGHIKSQIAYVPQLPDRWHGRLPAARTAHAPAHGCNCGARASTPPEIRVSTRGTPADRRAVRW